MVPQHIIDEAKAMGIVPGVLIETATENEYTQTVRTFEEWYQADDGAIWNGPFVSDSICIYSARRDKWATVITPAPQAAPEGLVEGDACECGPAMRAAIIELAKELGVECSYLGSNDYPVAIWDGRHIDGASPTYVGIKDIHAPEAFIAKMRVEAAKPKPIRIGDHEVKFNAGSIKVGCTTIDNATVRAIAANLKD